MAAFNKILIIDDDDLFLHLCEFIMEDEDFATEVITYDYANKALEYLKSLAVNDLPEVVFLDINMPLMDGWEFMEALEIAGMENKMRIYITSSSIDPRDLKRVEHNPFIKGLISKPLDPEKLDKIKTAV